MGVLQKLDIFGTPITFKISEKEQYHSIISVSLTLISFLSTILFSYFFGLDFIFHLESQVLQSTRTNKTYEFHNLSIDNFFVAWQIEDTNSREINFTNILYPTVGYYSYKTDLTETLKYDRCKNYNLSFNIPNDIKNYYCFDTKNYTQGGDWENENKIEYIYLNIGTCRIYNCSKKSDFENLLDAYGRMYLVIYYPTVSFVPEDEIPYEISFNKKNIVIDTKLVNVNRFYIQKYIFDDDEGWIVPKIKTKKLFGISEIDTSVFLNEDNEEENYKFIMVIYTLEIFI